MLDALRETALPATRGQDGFVSLQVLVNRERGEALITTFWEDEEALRASDREEHVREQVRRLLVHLRRLPLREVYEVDLIS